MRTTTRGRNRLWCLLFTFLVSACGPKIPESRIAEIPIDVIGRDPEEIEIESVVKVAREQVQSLLPDAYLTFFQYRGQCTDLTTLQGQFQVGFIQVRPGFPRRRVISALASVDPVRKVMDTRFLDVSDRYPSTTPLNLEGGLDIREAVALAQEEIRDQGLASCDVALTRFDDIWLVECTRVGSGILGERLCEFQVDATTGEIRNEVDTR